jgi:hypothetical protein
VIDPRVGCARNVRQPDLSPANLADLIPNLRLVIFATLIIVFLRIEPTGLNRLWRKVLNYFRVWPFSY